MQKNKGFSLIEILIVISIIAIGLLGMVSVIRMNIMAQSVSKNYLIASMLAQEGLELVRGKRDQNWLDNPDSAYWIVGKDGTPNGASSLIQNDGSYTIDYTGKINQINDIDFATNDGRLYSNNGFYNLTGGDPTPFYRIIKVTPVDMLSDYIIVECTVQWKERAGTNKYVATTYLYNWR